LFYDSWSGFGGGFEGRVGVGLRLFMVAARLFMVASLRFMVALLLFSLLARGFSWELLQHLMPNVKTQAPC